MYLIDTNIISEIRKGDRANTGVRQFFTKADCKGEALFLSAITIGELRRGIELIRYRGDESQAQILERWFMKVTKDYAGWILPLDADIAQVWGKLRVPYPENALDKQIAATALIHNLTVVTRNEKDFSLAGVPVLNPFNKKQIPD